ncbi:MAG: hypothetical protein JXA69_07835 [Phycisphaerae bacterium]|nr:hypothetical protein [Phycisphaerae bacterium]
MNGLLRQILQPEVIVFLVPIVIAVTAILAGTWWKVRQHELETALKQDMLNRGMSVDEIERVMRATRGKPDEPKDD